jgi:hypothetical protein
VDVVIEKDVVVVAEVALSEPHGLAVGRCVPVVGPVPATEKRSVTHTTVTHDPSKAGMIRGYAHDRRQLALSNAVRKPTKVTRNRRVAFLQQGGLNL